MRLIFSINARFLSREITSFSRGRSDRIVVRVIAQSKQQVNFNHAIERTRRLGESSPNWWCTSYTLFFVYRAVCFSLGAPRLLLGKGRSRDVRLLHCGHV